MTRLADAYYDQDKDKDAEMLYRKILSVQQISEESQSEANLWVQFDLIECISFQSRYVEAKEMLKRVYAAIAGKFASHHPIFRRYLNVKATILDSTENYEEKEDISRDVIQLCLVHLGPRHPSTLDAIYRLGVTLWARNKYFESEQLQRIAIYFYQEGTEVLHDICWSMINLGRVFEGQNRLEDATRLYSLAFEKAKEGLGDEHRTTMLSCYHLGRLLREMGSLQESEELLRTTCALQIRVLGEEHPNSLWTMCHLGETLRQRVKYEESVSLLEECFQKCLDLLELDYRLTGACCDYLGLCYEDQERYGDALALYHKAVDKIRGAGEIGIWRVEGFQDRIERIYLEMEDGYDEEENPQSE
jgi:tetratricopeptide (TPR) repeat protein